MLGSNNAEITSYSGHIMNLGDALAGSKLRNHDALADNDSLLSRHNPAKCHHKRIGAIG
jgi:hypothetical protein